AKSPWGSVAEASLKVWKWFSDRAVHLHWTRGGNSLVKPIPSLSGRKTFIKKLKKPYRMAMRKKRANFSSRRKFFGRNPRRAALTLRIKYVTARLCYLLHRPGAHTTSTQIAIRLACV